MHIRTFCANLFVTLVLKQKKMKKSYCPIDTFINTIKGKRKCTIILHLFQGDKRYGELVKLLPDISERMMTKQLKELTEDGLITRTVFAEVPPRVDYSLTALGKEIHPTLKSMFRGGLLFEKSIIRVEN
ncbi:transcriptional regulator, HxlR family [Polaribacter sp. KT25b]|nr:transcriptional regulator, HxlR family [Polaribacter sp. KT25b]